MAASPEPNCLRLPFLPDESLAEPVAASQDEPSKLIVTTRSMTSMEDSSCMSDEHETSNASIPEAEKKDSLVVCGGTVPPTLRHASKLNDESISSISFGLPHSPAAPGHFMLAHQAHDTTASTDSVDADNPSYTTAASYTGNDSRGRGAEVYGQPRTVNMSASATRVGRQVPVEGSIDSFHEYIRPNAETSFLFSFTPTTGTEYPDKDALEHALIGQLEKVRIENRPSQPVQKSVRLRRRRGVDVRSLTFDDWRPSTVSQEQERRELSSQQVRMHSASDPVHADADVVPDTKATEDRRRFDYLVSRLQQKLSERSQDDSKEERSRSDTSRHSSKAESAKSLLRAPSISTAPTVMSGSEKRAAWPSTEAVVVDSSSNRPASVPGGREGPSASNERQYLPPLQPLPFVHPQQSPGLHQPFMPQFQGPPAQPAHYFPHVFPAMAPQYPGAWNMNLQGGGVLSTDGQPAFAAAPFYSPHLPPPTQPRVAAWPQHYGHQPVSHHARPAVPPPPAPRIDARFSAPAPSSPRRQRSNKSGSSGRIPYIPLSSSDQQKIEEHIEFLKATVPSFAMVSKRRQQLRWLRENAEKERQQKKQQEQEMLKLMQASQPPAHPPLPHWNQQPYPELHRPFYQQVYPVAHMPRPMMYGAQPFPGAMALPSMPWPSL